MSSVRGIGRFGNQVIRSLCASLFCRKHNLFVDYKFKKEIEKLGVKLFVGKKKHKESIILTDDNYFENYNKELNKNIKTTAYFQTKKITDFLHSYLNEKKVMKEVMEKNKFKNRYNNNEDCFIHIRLGDVEKYNPGFEYYDKILNEIKCKNIYISTDSLDHDIIKKLTQKYKIQIVDKSLDEIILFGSTCKFVILSYGTFSALIGYLSYYSYVYCLKYCKQYAWDFDKGFNMFNDKKTKIKDWIIRD